MIFFLSLENYERSIDALLEFPYNQIQKSGYMYVRIEFTSIHIYNVRSYMNTQCKKSATNKDDLKGFWKYFSSPHSASACPLDPLHSKKNNHEMLILVFQANNAAPLNSIFFCFYPTMYEYQKTFFFYAYVDIWQI